MPYIHKMHLADKRAPSLPQVHTVAVCRRVEAFLYTTEDLEAFFTANPPRLPCKNCAKQVRAANRRLDARDRRYGR